MAQTPDEIKSEIEQARSRLGQDLNELQYRVRRTTDWRSQFDRHPWAFLGAAFGGAMALAMMIGGRRRVIVERIIEERPGDRALYYRST